MATGGLGGVHRGAAESFDVSTDLDELARADGSLVVCSGSKSILDLPATLEALETLGVAVCGYRTGEFPAFTTASSGLPLEHRVETAVEAAAILRTHRELGVPGAVVLANPVPAEAALDRGLMETALAAAIDEARRLGIAGKDITPFLLARSGRRPADRVSGPTVPSSSPMRGSPPRSPSHSGADDHGSGQNAPPESPCERLTLQTAVDQQARPAICPRD